MRGLLNFVDFAVVMTLGVIVCYVQLRAVADCLRTPAADFARAYKRTKQFWGLMTGVSAVLGLAYVFGALSATLLFGQFVPPSLGMGMLLNLAGVTAAAVYLADVRPALVEVRGHGRGRQSRGPSW